MPDLGISFFIFPNIRKSYDEIDFKPEGGARAFILIGCAVIIALSTYWNVIAFTGKEVLRLASLDKVTRAESHYSTMLSKTGSYQKLVPQLESLSSSAFSLADSEELNGALTGSRGKGGVSEALRQIGTKVASITASIRNVVQKSEGLKAKGQACLSAMRKATETGFSVEAASDLANGVDCLNGVMAELGQNDAAGSIAGVMQGLSASVVLPVSIRTDSQRQALDNVLKGLQAQANSIASFARTIPDAAITPFQIVRPNMASAVLQQWQGVMATCPKLDIQVYMSNWKDGAKAAIDNLGPYGSFVFLRGELVQSLPRL